MKHYYILFPVILSIGMLLGGLIGCTDKESGAVIADENMRRETHAINLFPRELSTYNNIGKMSFDEAFVQSTLVIHAADLVQLDHSNSRSVKPFYIYQVDKGTFEKSANAKETKFPIFFLSREELFKGKLLGDSVYVFLAPLRQYQVLQHNAGITYKWVNEAPFLRHQDTN